MAGEEDFVTEVEVSATVKKLMSEGDPATMTNRTLANSVIEHFGKRLGPLHDRVINIVRKQTKALAEVPRSDPPSGAVKNVSASEELNVNANSEKPQRKTDDENSAIKKPEDKAIDESALDKTEDKAIGENVGSAEQEQEKTAPSENPKTKDDAEPVEKDVDDDDEFNPDDDDEMSEEGSTKRGRSGRKQDFDSDDGSQSRAQKSRRKRGPSKRKASASATAALSSADKELKKQMKLCRELGVRYPYAKFKGIDDAKEKVRMVKAFLAEKGVDANGGRMTQGRIRELRKRMDRDKELAGLDSDNIIAEGRSKRRRTIVSYADQKDEEDEEDSSPGKEDEEAPQSDGEDYKAESGSDSDDE